MSGTGETATVLSFKSDGANDGGGGFSQEPDLLAALAGLKSGTL